MNLNVFYSLESDPVFLNLIRYNDSQSSDDFNLLMRELLICRAEENLSFYVENLILHSENVFSKSAANGEEISSFLRLAVELDLTLIYEAINKLNSSVRYSKGKFSLLSGNVSSDYVTLQDFYSRNGYGIFIDNRAFRLDSNDELEPVTHPSAITLQSLKDYEEEKRIVLQNVESFVMGLPFSNMLLYGERGTGKSSTVHAIVNKYFSRKLRIVEINKENVFHLGKLKARLASVPMKFMIFIDDLSLPSGDERISTLKATLEGALEGHADNVMIVATSNRRHIVDEKFSVRNDSVHAGDSMQEELSLSDRFGISVLFASTTKPQYLSIVRQLAADEGIKTETAELELLAERFAISKGGRSPRRAKQFVSLLSAAEQRGVKLEF